MPLWKLLIPFLVLPWLELVILLHLAQFIGAGGTILLILATGILGASLTRLEGLRVLGEIHQSLEQGRVPANELLEGVLVLIAGVVLLTPGLLTDTAGFLLLIPPCRAALRKRLVTHFQTRVKVSFGSSQASTDTWTETDRDHNTIDVDARFPDEKQ